MLSVNCNAKSSETLKHRIDSLLNATYASDEPGVSLLIAKNGIAVYEGASGIADVITKEKIDGNTAFNIASISKQFTAVAALKMEEDGKIDLNESVAKYFPEFKNKFWNDIKLWHLLSHCSGIPDLRPRSNRNFTLYATDEQSIEYMKELDSLKFTPGAYYDYINPTFDLFYVLIQRCSGIGFEDYQRINIFDVAQMENAQYFSPDKQIDHMAHGYIKSNNVWKEYDYGEETFFATKADGGIYTTTRDFLKWENALYNGKIISLNSLRKAYTRHIKVSESPYCQYQNRPKTWYGLGWFIDENFGNDIKIYHTGDNGGFQAYAAKYIKNRINVIMFENRNDIDRWSMQLKIERILKEEGLLQ